MKNHYAHVSSEVLHILAMLFMVLDHLWAVVFPAQLWMTLIGRLAFPIFAFLTVEGFLHTRNFKKYLARMFLFAVISEIPFDYMYSGLLFYPYHQNVLWIFLISLICMYMLEKARTNQKTILFIPIAVLICISGFLAGTISMSDYYGPGVLTVLVFYFLRRKTPLTCILQLLLLYWINTELLGGLCFTITLFGISFEFVQQGIAVLALIPIWLYGGNKRIHSKTFQYFCYAFYPAHCLLIGFLR